MSFIVPNPPVPPIPPGAAPGLPEASLQFNSTPAGTFTGSGELLVDLVGSRLLIGAAVPWTLVPAPVGVGNGLSLTLAAGSSSAVNSEPGVLNLVGGAGTQTANERVSVNITTPGGAVRTGAISISTGNATLPNRKSGDISIFTGNAFGAASPSGSVIIGTGSTSPANNAAPTGPITLTTGAPAAGYNSGSISIGTAAASGTGASGNVTLETNPGGSGHGYIRMSPGGLLGVYVHRVASALQMRINSNTPTAGAETVQINGNLSINANVLLRTYTAFLDGAAAAAGTLTNAPTAGDPTKWIPINDNGTTRYIPAW